jgi:hypothetical protein
MWKGFPCLLESVWYPPVRWRGARGRIGGQALTKIRSPLIKKCLAKLDERPLQVL